MLESLWNSKEVGVAGAGREEREGWARGLGTREPGALHGAVQGTADPASSGGLAWAAGGGSSRA